MHNGASVIIPTFGRTLPVIDTLYDLFHQNFTDFEVILIDQNQPPLELPQELQTWPRLKHHKVSFKGSHLARNYAVERAYYDLCIFVDDDVSLGPSFIATHLEQLAEFKKSDALLAGLAGRVLQPKDGFDDHYMASNQRRPSYDSRTGRVSGNFFGLQALYADHIHECNFSLEKAVYLDVGGFDSAFAGNAYFEGADLALKIKRLGRRFMFSPTPSLVHHQAPSGGNREIDKAKHTYWFVRNYCLLNSRYQDKRIHFRLLFVGYLAIFVSGRALKNRNRTILLKGFQALTEGLGLLFCRR